MGTEDEEVGDRPIKQRLSADEQTDNNQTKAGEQILYMLFWTFSAAPHRANELKYRMRQKTERRQI